MHQEFMKTLLSDQISGDKLPILCNQENFILRGNAYKIIQAFPDYHIFINPAVKTNLDTGRPRGGMFIAVPNSVKGQVCDVSPGHWRVQAVTILSSSSKTLLVNTYLPCDNQPARAIMEETIEVLGIIKRVYETSGCDSLLWCGDMNTDFGRHSRQVDHVQDTLEELHLSRVWDKYWVDFTWICNENSDNPSTSVIDHFFICSKLGPLIQDAGVLYSAENRSDHSPV